MRMTSIVADELERGRRVRAGHAPEGANQIRHVPPVENRSDEEHGNVGVLARTRRRRTRCAVWDDVNATAIDVEPLDDLTP